MEESDEPEQPISLGRQEFRRRRRPSQPMVDKSQQTEATEKKKLMAVVQPPAPKATLSIGNISGSKGNYSAKEYASLRLSSQLQKTWVKRKRGQDVTDKSLQTDTAVEEKVEVIYIDKALTLEETPAAAEETALELPQSVPEVEIPTSRPATHLIDRSQQTSCTGDWSLMNICPKDKVDKEQQTYFSELEITIMSMPRSSLPKSKEETIPAEIKASLEIQVVSTEEISNDIMCFTEGEISAELQAQPADEATAKALLFLTEELPTQAPSPAGETSASGTATTTTKDSLERQPPLDDELTSVQPPTDITPLSGQEGFSDEPSDQPNPEGAEVAPSELTAEILVPITEEVLGKVQALAIETFLEETSGKVEPTTAEESTGEVQPPPSEEVSIEVPAEVRSPLTRQVVEEVSAETVHVVSEELPTEEVIVGGQPPSAEEVPVDRATAGAQPPSAEDIRAEEIQPPPAEEVLREESPAQGPPPPTEEAVIEDMAAETPPAPTEESIIEDMPAETPPAPTEESIIENMPAETPPPPTEEAIIENMPAEGPPPPTEESIIENMPAEGPPSPTEEAPTEAILAEGPRPPTEKSPEEPLPPPAVEGPTEEVPAEALSPPAEEVLAEALPSAAEENPAEVPPPPTEERPEEVPLPPTVEHPEKASSPPVVQGPAEEALPLPAEENPAEAPPPPTEENPAEAPPPPAVENLAEALPLSLEENPAEALPPPVEVDLPEVMVLFPSGESLVEEASSELQPPFLEWDLLEDLAPEKEVVIPEAEEILLEHLPVEVKPLTPEEDVAEGVSVEFQALPAEYPAREATVEAQRPSLESASIEETLAEAQLPLAEAGPAEEGPAVQPLSLAPSDEAPAEYQFLQTEETPIEEAPVEVQPLPAEEVFTEVVPVEETPASEVGYPSSEGDLKEEATVEAQLTSVEESPEKASAGVQPPPPESPAGESSDVNGVPMEDLPMNEMPAEDPLSPSEQTSENEDPLKDVQESVISDKESAAFTGVKKSERTDSVSEDVSKCKDDQFPTFKIEGTIKIELKNSS
ncbi:fibrous sheath CABYR-binding protein [Acomys russatus]|uniref:fibrous sheath CABYR-binding protein n=1 Tax=Acomys russatus TaxID=60746 RepID=UPI0021E1E336|nr:fibrous sheath CABYR-binding protein [Acomys russatus]